MFVFMHGDGEKKDEKKRIFTSEPSRVKMDEDDVANDKVRVRSERVYKMRKLLRIFKAREQKKLSGERDSRKKARDFLFILVSTEIQQWLSENF